MSWYRLLPLFFICIAHTSRADYANCASGSGQVYQRWCWQYFSSATDWVSAFQACMVDGGTLAQIYSRDYWVALQTYINQFPGASPFIGLGSCNATAWMFWSYASSGSMAFASYSTLKQNLTDAVQFTFDMANGPVCHTNTSCGQWCCCYSMHMSSPGQYDLLPNLCLPLTSPFQTPACQSIETRPYVCEYENCQRSANFSLYTLPGYINGGTIAPLKAGGATSASACGQQCMTTRYCVSFDFENTSSICNLYATTMRESPNAFVPNPSYQHFDLYGSYYN